MEKTAQELLLYSLDNDLTPAERARLDAALASSEALRREREELVYMRELVSDLGVKRDHQFTDSVMNRLQEEKEKDSGFWSDIVSLSPRVAAACIAFVIVSLVGIYFWEGKLSPESIIGTEQLTPEDAFTIQEQRQPQKKDKENVPLEIPKRK